MYVRTVVCVLLSSYIWLSMCATLCSLNRCILFSVFYVLPFGVINDDDHDDDVGSNADDENKTA